MRSKDVDRELVRPKSHGTTDAINYGGGIVIENCTECGRFWLDATELEKIQRLMEGRKDNLPDDLRQYGPVLRKVEVDKRDDVHLSRPPDRLIHSMINGILNLCGL